MPHLFGSSCMNDIDVRRRIPSRMSRKDQHGGLSVLPSALVSSHIGLADVLHSALLLLKKHCPLRLPGSYI